MESRTALIERVSSQFEDLARAIHELVVPIDGDALVDVRGLLDALTARVALAEAAFVSAGLHELDGAGSMATWLRHRSGLTDADARRASRRAERLARWRSLGDAWVRGDIAGPVIDAAVAIIPDRHVERFSLHDEETVRALDGLSTHESRMALRHWVEWADAELEAEAARLGLGSALEELPQRSLFLSRTLDDVAVLDGRFDADSAAVIEAALRVAERADDEGETRLAAERRADALVALCAFYLDNHQRHGDAGRQRPNVSVVIDLPTMWSLSLRGAGIRTREELDSYLERHRAGPIERAWFVESFTNVFGTATTLDGRVLSAAMSRVFTCDSVMSRLITAGGRVLNHGRSVREFTSSQRQAVFVRDQGCRYPGCTAGPRSCDIHHVIAWELGGQSDLQNAVALCRHHHGVIHRPGWSTQLDEEGEFRVLKATGEELASRPPARAPATFPPSKAA
ncbi:MAG: DUF222 domain-containing protein [Actinobacteria bacterium]|uniref:Unannotated protein n=1 Tax=freshwater metagenome TaxID=449393 RepID=A0A6J7VLX6_9ZZZZ|nr:DUF222 domain-containing protein [Actinomycetota bacterium]